MDCAIFVLVLVSYAKHKFCLDAIIKYANKYDIPLGISARSIYNRAVDTAKNNVTKMGCSGF